MNDETSNVLAATESRVSERWGFLDWTCYHIDGQRLVPEGEDCPACGKRNRPPWNQELSPDERDEWLSAARAVGGDVEKWAIRVFYIQSALSMDVARLERELWQARSALRRIFGLLTHRHWWNDNAWGAREIAKDWLLGERDLDTDDSEASSPQDSDRSPGHPQERKTA